MLRTRQQQCVVPSTKAMQVRHCCLAIFMIFIRCTRWYWLCLYFSPRRLEPLDLLNSFAVDFRRLLASNLKAILAISGRSSSSFDLLPISSSSKTRASVSWLRDTI
ncbi:hypothetical protein HZ326_29060 [Fusarium oxysporum f. sp. albedinis]|nr:hypothetical protein HZ326_29060 [Fusarium oxysporum f. sp. albedinis]